MQLRFDFVGQQDEPHGEECEPAPVESPRAVAHDGPETGAGLEDVTVAVLEGIRHVLDATASSVWLIDPFTGELVCEHSTDPKESSIHGWRLAPGEGIAGWVADNRRSLIVADTRLEWRHCGGVDQVTGLECRSILAVPMLTRDAVVGVIEVIDCRPGRFTNADLPFVESLAATAAIAVENLQSHARQYQLVVDRERSRLARDLHDSVVQALYSIDLAANASLVLLERHHRGGGILRPLRHIVALTRQTLADLHESLYDLDGDRWTDRGLGSMLAAHCAILKQQYQLDVRLAFDGGAVLTSEQKAMLYYVAREALWNVVRHAKASRADIRLVRELDEIVMCIADDGIGFECTDPAGHPVCGMSSMRARAEKLGGTLSIESCPGQGTVVTVRVPFADQSAIVGRGAAGEDPPTTQRSGTV